jgi:DDE superfamily endonuclease
MPVLPADVMTLFVCFAPVFSTRVWRHVPLLVVGAILAPGQRTVAAVLRVLGLGQLVTFQTYHRVLNRARWSSRQASQILFSLLLTTFAPHGPLVVGLDETLERRRGRKISAAGIYRDPVRSSRSHFVKVRGLRWICAMLLVPIPWAGRVWALPFFTVLAPSEREAARRRRRYKPLTTWARQMVRQVHRWAVNRPLVIVGDRSYAALELLDAVRPIATVVARLRLDARLFAPPPPRAPHAKGRPRLVGERLPNLSCHRDDPSTLWSELRIPRWYGERDRPIELLSQTAVWYSTGFPPVPIRWVLIRDPRGIFPTQALLCTDLDATPLQIVSWFVLRWQLEVTFHEVRAHLGVETQRQWSQPAIQRTTPALLGLFSLVTLLAHGQRSRPTSLPRQTAWYSKTTPTFVDALALVRRRLWAQIIFQTALPGTDLVKLPRTLVERFSDLLCYAA